MADIRDVTFNNGYIIVCEYQGKSFKSKTLGTEASKALGMNAAAEIKRLGFTQLPVFIDSNNPGKYSVDTSELLKALKK